MSPHIRAFSVRPHNRPFSCTAVSIPCPELSERCVVPRAVSRHICRIIIFFVIAAIILVLPGTANPVDSEGITQHPDNTGNGPARESTRYEYAGSGDTVILPSIANNETPGVIPRRFTYTFQQTNITIRLNVSTAVYYGAKAGDKFALSPKGTTPETLAPDYYRAFVNDPHQEQVYTDLLREFRSARQEHQYSDDEYLELMTVFVQSLPYDNEAAARPDTPSRFPVETLVDGTGDCDDKSVLLAGLLAREGYNVSLLLFIPEHHMALGVKSDCMQYRDTGYTYGETTGVSFMGEVPARLNQSVKYVPPGKLPQKTPLSSLPLVIRVGSGSKPFTSADKTGYILQQKKKIDARIAAIRDRLDDTSWDSPSRYRTLMESYTTYAKIHNFIVTHEQDREGTYRYLALRMPPAVSSMDQGTDHRCPSGTLNEETTPAWYVPCPRGIWVQQRCVWQSVQQEIAISTIDRNYPVN